MKHKLSIFGVLAVLIVAVVLGLKWERKYSISKLPPIEWTEQDVEGHSLSLDDGDIVANYRFDRNGICDIENGRRGDGLSSFLRYWKIEHGKLVVFDRAPGTFHLELWLLKRETKQVIVRESTGENHTYLVDLPKNIE